MQLVLTSLGGLALAQAPPAVPAGDLAWARAQVPALASHHTVDPSGDRWVEWARWFTGEGPHTVYLGGDHACAPATGTLTDDGTFAARWRFDAGTRDGRPTRTWETLVVSRHGIHGGGDAGESRHHDADGTEFVRAWAGGDLWTLTERSLSEVDDNRARFAGRRYRVVLDCARRVLEPQTCEDGGSRTCGRCTAVGVLTVPLASNAGAAFTANQASSGHGAPPVDCTRPCPFDVLGAQLPALQAAVDSEVFFDAQPGGAVDLFRTLDGCRAGGP